MVVGGLVVSTVFTLFLVPMILSVEFDIRQPRPSDADEAHDVAVEVEHNGQMGRARALGAAGSRFQGG